MQQRADADIVPFPAVIDERRPLSPDTVFYRLRPENDDHARFRFNPGQFVQLSVPGAGEAPISLAGAQRGDGMLEVCVRGWDM